MQRRTVNPARAVQHTLMLANPLAPLASELGKAIARAIAQLDRRSESDQPSPSVHALRSRIATVAAEVLERTLSSPTVDGKALRMALICKLANEEMRAAQAPPDVTEAPAAETLLTIAGAAAKLETSRPHVSMLCNAGKLGEALTLTFSDPGVLTET
jgi:hypothetical protein